MASNPREMLGDDKPDRSDKGAKPTVDFSHQVAPILQKHCAKCHAGAQRNGGFSINTRQTLMAGGEGGPAAVARRSSESALIERVTSGEPNFKMPPEGERLTREQVDHLRRWIDGGLSWEDGFAFGKNMRQAPLPPRRPALLSNRDEGDTLRNPIDQFVQPYFSEHEIEDQPLVTDTVFARRAALDLTGLTPSPAEINTLIADPRSDKRQRFVDRLLDDRAAYTAHWLTFWNDLLRNAYHGTGFIDGGRHQITNWLYGALHENKPYDRFVKELVSPAPGSDSEGFTYGIKWRGTVNESQRREIQAAQSVAQVFLGTNIKCASCHDSFVNHWKLTDAYGLASVFAEGTLELHRCDQPTGVTSTASFLYPQLGAIDANAPRSERVRQLAGLLTHPENGRLARAIVNRLWAKLFGRGLVEPLDNLDVEAWHQDLLDYLAADLADQGYDLKRTLRLMANSQAYQLPGVSHSPAEGGSGYVFHGPLVKRMTAEQFVDAVFGLTETWPACDAALLKRDGRGQGGQLGEIARALADLDPSHRSPDRQPLSRARWIWIRTDADSGLEPKTVYLRRTWHLEERPPRGTATFSAIDSFQLSVNEKVVAKSADWQKPVQVDITSALQPGLNVLALKVVGTGDRPNPSGAIGEVFTLGSDGRRGAVLSTNQSWQVSETSDSDWLKVDFKAEGWHSAIELGDSSAGPWNLAQRIVAGGTGVQSHAPLPDGFRIRAALLPLDALQSALGRPNREQIVSARDSVPTLLQALQLTNGTILGRQLAEGAAVWHKTIGTDPLPLIDRAYRTALGRLPSDEERRLALEIVGSVPEVESIEDLLWTICMLPEFQLVP